MVGRLEALVAAKEPVRASHSEMGSQCFQVGEVEESLGRQLPGEGVVGEHTAGSRGEEEREAKHVRTQASPAGDGWKRLCVHTAQCTVSLPGSLTWPIWPVSVKRFADSCCSSLGQCRRTKAMRYIHRVLTGL